MLLAPHAIAGLVIAKYSPDLLPAALAAVTSHFILDYIPHRDMMGGEHINRANIALRACDLCATVLLFFWLVPKESWVYSAVVAGFALLPDLISLPVLAFPRLKELPGFKQYHHWHTEQLQYSWGKVNWFWGLLPQALVLAWSLYLLIR